MARHRWATSAPSRGGFSFPQDREGQPAEPVTFDTLEPSDDAAPHAGAGAAVGVQDAARRGRQWAVGRGAALVALGLALSLAVGLFFLRGGAPSEVTSIALDRPTSGQQGGGAAAGLSDAAQSGTAEASESRPGDSQPEDSPPGDPPPGELVGSDGSTVAPGSAGSGAGSAGAGSPGAVSEPGPGSQRLIVHVAGAVSRPGIVELDAGSRVFEALEQAGGALPDADLAAINLASPVQDGLQIRVPVRGETLPPVVADPPLPGPGSPDPTATGPPGTPGIVNINTADTAELETLPRIGPVLAERIIAWRTDHGGFSSPEDLDAVPGIGEAMLAALVPLVTV
ncbi:ComEA family DNA-binding protein [Arthrobacter sp. CAN_C5]|uniref:ComEA family DNA-binding protein n=1 Tax=Arthrobacter sp. CAN_C5 TaxID=2760706 RepID=UPI001AE30B76|nr:ComEA family DNA-binding protein [Arthrobacter sp. CAN_C5]MBP2216577.1 competence protein ComEA [Arthrobacter sp. CAN_C5]